MINAFLAVVVVGAIAVAWFIIHTATVVGQSGCAVFC